MRACKILIATLLMFLLIWPGMAEGTDNLLVNGDFEEVNGQGLPSGWYTDAYVHQEGYTVWSVSNDARTGEHSAIISNLGDNDARFAQRVAVEPNSYYCFSGYIKVLDMGDYGRGANLSIEGLYAFSQSLYDVSDTWVYLEMYGQTGPDQHDVTVLARVGGYSGESLGSAQFDDLSLRKVDGVPGNVTVQAWYRDTTPQQVVNVEEEDHEAGPAWPWLIAISAVYILMAVWMMGYLRREPVSLKESWHAPWFLIVGLIAAAAARIAVAWQVEGYPVDVNCFISWGSTMARVGPFKFYQTVSFCDYTPAYVYVMGLCGLILKIPGITLSAAFVHKLVPMASDIAMAYLLYRFARKRMDRHQAGLLVLLFALNPAMVLNSAAWCQIDSVLCLLLMLVAWLAVERRWAAVLPVYVFAALVKPQALMLGPLGLAAIVFELARELRANSKKPAKEQKPAYHIWRPFLLGLVISAAVAAVVIIPFSIHQTEWNWLFKLYGDTLSSYPYATVNTANLYYLTDANWVSINAGCDGRVLIIFMVLSAMWGGYLLYRQRKMKLDWIESAIMFLFSGAYLAMFVVMVVRASSSPDTLTWSYLAARLFRPETVGVSITWTHLGATAMAMSFVIVLGCYIRSGKLENLPLCGAVLFILLYVLGIKMHERYLFPALILLAMAYAVRRDIRVLGLLVLTSCTMLINEGVVLDNALRLGSSMGHLNNDTMVLNDLVSAVNVATAFLAAYTCHSVCVMDSIRSGRMRELERHPRRVVRPSADPGLHWKRLDWILMLSVTLVYAVVTLTTLGSAKAPQNPWKSTAPEETVIIDLGQPYDDVSMLYFCQVSKLDFSVAVSDDGENWSGEYWAQMAEGQCYRWKYLVPSYGEGVANRTYVSADTVENVQKLSGRYVRITACQIGLVLNEVIFRDAEGQTIPATVLRAENANPDSPNYSDPAAVLDEQDTLDGEPSWWNGTYFDEIYHARTAYEHLHGTKPYETSHPPLGKVIMSWGVAIFGMTPFGWRFAGALAGILMLPAMYVLGKQMFKRTSIAFATMAMMTLDCMHFTQTRIATIDSFPVLFIILSWLFMLRFTQRDLTGDPIKKLLPDLALCGFFMGCGIASKWIGIYSGAGLALVYFWTCGRHLSLKWDKALVLLLYLGLWAATIALVALGTINKWVGAGIGAVLGAAYYWIFERHLAMWNGKAFRRMLYLCMWCVLFFVVVPVIIYLLSYIPYFAYIHKEDLRHYIELVIQAQNGMFDYHSTPGLGMDHPFYSPWYEWPLIKRPMYYASPSFEPEGYSFAIWCFGNPAVWLTGLAGIAAAVVIWIKGHIYSVKGSDLSLHATSQYASMTPAFILLGLLAQFLPWMLVPRGTYIYHYFASVPFLILGISLVLHLVQTRFPKVGRAILIVYLLVCLGFFIAYFPYASGLMTPVSWLDHMKKFLRVYY